MLPNVLNEFFSSVGQTLAASVPPANHHFSDYLPAVNSPSPFFFEPVTSMELETDGRISVDGLVWTVGLTVEVKLRFRDGLVWTAGLTVEMKLRFQ